MMGSFFHKPPIQGSVPQRANSRLTQQAPRPAWKFSSPFHVILEQDPCNLLAIPIHTLDPLRHCMIRKTSACAVMSSAQVACRKIRGGSTRGLVGLKLGIVELFSSLQGLAFRVKGLKV